MILKIIKREEKHKYVSTDEYLSGNVREKLKIAEEVSNYLENIFWKM